MYLKNLTVLGFKSFADKTTLNFQPGVTAIVGPNGCGKSNVSDAIRWVLGEQSAKALRGGEMADVIFNGTDSRKPMGMAEVSLTIGDVDTEHLSAAGVAVEFNEVTLSRRVFRDGGSEYFINKTPCRLRDIQQLFMGTGVGRTSYSIMAQGHITQIISSRPDDRRMVFEEAAGITKFKAQKREALRKLEHTEQNLLRVQDLIREVKRQIISLQRQAGKARRYKVVAQELQHLETQLARHQLDVMQGEINERRVRSEEVRSGIELAQEQVLRLEDEILQVRSRVAELEQEISASQHRGLELKSQADRQESLIAFNEERIQELSAQNERALHDINQSEERRQIAEIELTGLNERLVASAAAVLEFRAALEEKRSALQVLDRDATGKQEEVRGAQSAAFSSAQQLARVRNEITALELQKQGNVVRLEKLSAEKISLEEERARLEARLAEFAAQVATEQQTAQSSRGTLEDQQQRLKQIQQELNAAATGLDELLRRQAELRSRLNVLEQLDSSREGFGSGALAALQKGDGVLGSLADRIRVPAEFVTAVEAALGHNLQLVLTEEPEAALQILGDLNAGKKGRASIAALTLRPADTGASADAVPPGAILALSVVTCDPAVAPLLEALLGQTCIVSDLSEATNAFQRCGGRFSFVTRGGESLARHGVFTGGSSRATHNEAASILGRKNQITELQSSLTQVAEAVAEASRRKGAAQSELTMVQASLQEVQTELRAREVAIATHQGEFNALQVSQRTLHQKIDTVVYEVQSLAAQEQDGMRKRHELAEQVAALEVAEQAASSRVATLTATLEQLRQDRDAANARVSDAKVSLATEEQLCASHARQKAPLEQRILELAQHLQRLQGELGSFSGRKEKFEVEIGSARREIAKLQGEREVVSTRIAALLEQKSTQEADLSEREEQLRSHRHELTGLQQQRGQIEVELAQKTMAEQNLRERIQSKYQVDLDSIPSEAIKITFADEGQAKVETVTAEEMAAAGLSTDWEAVGREVASLQRKLDEMGPVNLVAIEEYEETEQRFNFLNTQNDDLVSAKAQLVEVINKINGETKTMFLETFEKIRANFQVMFTEVFGGGKADLRLIEEGDVLEAGIEIVARPPGKQLQSISLLSGGEQTMTAVALLFSIYQVRPSPFAVLDELDAPLDESNINRFLRVLQRFLEHSQFIIITHNKRTISMADVLYGVTMQERGVSKVVGVKFNKEEAGAERNTEVSSIADSVGGGESVAEQEVVMAK